MFNSCKKYRRQWESLASTHKHVLTTSLARVCIRYYKSSKNLYQVLQVLREFVSGTTSLERICIRYYKSWKNLYQVLQVLREFVSGTTSLERTCIRYYKSCVLYLNVQWDSYDKFSIIPVPRYTRYKLHHGNDYTALAYRIPGCAPASRLIWGQWRGRTTNKTDASEDQIPELQPSGLEADKDGRYVSACHLHSLFARLSHTQEPGKEATACNTNWKSYHVHWHAMHMTPGGLWTGVVASFPGSPRTRRRFRTASDGKAGWGLGTRLQGWHIAEKSSLTVSCPCYT